MRQRTGKSKYVKHAKHILEKTQRECYLEFQQLHPEIKVKQRRFKQLKPFFVSGARERDRKSCLCRKHVECRLLFDSCMKFRKQAQDGEVCTFEFLTQAVDSTLCEREDDKRYHALKCLTRDCPNCEVDKFRRTEEELSTETLFKWKRYEYITYEDKNGKERVSKETSVKEMFDYFICLLKDYPYHSFMAKWQKEQFDCLIKNLPLNHIITSENYTCRSQKETQSKYFDPFKVTVHVSVVYRHAIKDADDQESTEEKPVIVKEHFFALSEIIPKITISSITLRS